MTRENVLERITIGRGFTSNWITNFGARFLSQSLSAEMQMQITFDNEVKIALFLTNCTFRNPFAFYTLTDNGFLTVVLWFILFCRKEA